MKNLFFILFVATITFGCKKKPTIGLPYFNDADFTPIWLNKTDPGFKNLHTIPPFSFTDQHGKNITEKATAGKIYVVNFFFTRCENICPRMMDNMKIAVKAFAADSNVVFISHSVTPLYDNVSVLKKYASDKNITSPNWHLVTGDRDQIYTLARMGYFADTAPKTVSNTQFLHTENFILIDKNRHIRGVYNGTIELEVANLVRHIKMLKEED